MANSTTKVSIDLDADNYERFQEIYRMRGAVTWFFNACLEHFVVAHDFTPDELVYDSVHRTLETHEEER